MISKQSKGISSSKRFHTNSQGVSQCVTMSSRLKSFISSYLIQVFSPRLCLAPIFKWAMLFNSVFRKIPSHSMVWATLRKKCHNSLTKQLQPTSKRGQNARKTPLWDQEIACRPPMNWLAWNEPPPETQTEKMIFPTSPKHICQQSRYHMISHDVTFPAEAKDTSLYLEIFLQQTWITRETLPRMRRKHDQTDANRCKHSTQLWGKDEMMSTEAAVSRSLPRFAATTISLAHGPPTGISCHLSLASGITSIISLYILCYLVTTVYQQGAIKLPLFGGTNKGNWRKGDESHTTNSKRVWMHARLSFIYILSRCVSMQLSILCLGNPLVADLPLKLPLHHNTAIVEEQTMPARYDMIRYDDIKWNEMKATMNGYEHLWNRITAASNLNLPFSPIVSVSLRASRNPISLQDREDGNILGAHLAPISSRSHPRWKQCWVQQVKKKSHTRHTHTTHTWKPPKTSKGSPSWNIFADL